MVFRFLGLCCVLMLASPGEPASPGASGVGSGSPGTDALEIGEARRLQRLRARMGVDGPGYVDMHRRLERSEISFLPSYVHPRIANGTVTARDARGYRSVR